MLDSDVATSDPVASAGLKLRLKPSSGELRRKHVGYESSVRGLAFLLFSVGLLLCTAAVVAYFAPRVTGAVSAMIYLPAGLINLALGIALKDFNPLARLGVIILSGPGFLFWLLPSPMRPLPAAPPAAMSLLFLCLMLAPKSGMVFSPEYVQVLRETPEIRPRTSLLAWAGFALLIAGTLLLMLVMADVIWARLFHHGIFEAARSH